MEHLPDYMLEEKETDCSFTCLNCGEENELVFRGDVKGKGIELICKFCGENQDRYLSEPDAYDTWRDREPDED